MSWWTVKVCRIEKLHIGTVEFLREISIHPNGSWTWQPVFLLVRNNKRFHQSNLVLFSKFHISNCKYQWTVHSNELVAELVDLLRILLKTKIVGPSSHSCQGTWPCIRSPWDRAISTNPAGWSRGHRPELPAMSHPWWAAWWAPCTGKWPWSRPLCPKRPLLSSGSGKRRARPPTGTAPVANQANRCRRRCCPFSSLLLPWINKWGQLLGFED